MFCSRININYPKHITDIDNDGTLELLIKDNISYRSQIIQHFAPALSVIPTLPDGIDLVFIDADKKNYPNYLEAILPKMRKGGIILSDNVLWSGKVVENVKDNDKHTQVLISYNQQLANDSRLETILLPIRDGLSIARVR